MDYPPREATREQVEEALAGMPESNVVCRDIMHRWQWHTVVENSDHFERAFRCSRCRTIKRQILSLRGEILRSYYEYPRHRDGSEAYLTKGLGRITGDGRDAVRLASTRNRLNGKKE